MFAGMFPFFDNLRIFIESIEFYHKDNLSVRFKYFSTLASVLKVCAETKVALNAHEDLDSFNLAEAWRVVYDEIRQFETESDMLYMVEQKLRFYTDKMSGDRSEGWPIHVDMVISVLLRELNHMAWRNR